MKTKIDISRNEAVALLTKETVTFGYYLLSSKELTKLVQNHKPNMVVRSKLYLKIKEMYQQFYLKLQEIYKQENHPVTILEYVNKKLDK